LYGVLLILLDAGAFFSGQQLGGRLAGDGMDGHVKGEGRPFAQVAWLLLPGLPGVGPQYAALLAGSCHGDTKDTMCSLPCLRKYLTVAWSK